MPGIGIGVSRHLKKSAKSWSSYWPNRSLFFLDGTIIEDGGSYYFEDKSVNDRHFLITDYDFTDDWTKGFPYKSAATISAPVGDAYLIAADINNFLYDAGGAPNQIPVVSLFQNVDYENKIFCKHEARVVDNDDETYEPRVLEIYMAEIAESGAGLEKANTYFGVPEEVADAIWVATDGNDTTGDGTKENPIATFQKALTLAGSSVYLKTGITDMVEEGVTVGKNIYGIGYHRVINLLESSYKWNLGAVTVNIKNLYFNTGYGILFQTSNESILNVENCYFKEHTNYPIYVINVANVKNCIFTGLLYCISVNGSDSTISIEDCFYENPGQARFSHLRQNGINVILKFNKFTDVDYIMYGTTKLLGDIISYGNRGDCDYFLNCAHINSYTAKNDDLTCTSYYIQANTDAPADVNLSNIKVIANSVSKILSLVGKNLYAEHLIFVQNGAGSLIDISAPTTPVIAQITDSVFVSKHTSSGSMSIGDSTFITENNITGYFKRNIVLGNNLYVETPVATHGVCNWANDNFEIAYNFISGWLLSIVVKAPGTDLSNSSVHHNIIKNGALTLKCQKLNVYNNTFYSDINSCNHSSTKYDDIINSVDNIFKNNILITADYYNVVLNDVNQTIISDYNLYYNATGNMAVGQTFAQWQAATGQDANSRFLTSGEMAALLTDAANDIYTLSSGSLAIGYGVDLGEAFESGLDALTDWGGETELPTVSTKQQGVAWDVGAYVH